jgi:hypothetical protein
MLMAVFFISCGRDDQLSAPNPGGIVTTAYEVDCSEADSANPGLVSKVTMSALDLSYPVTTEYFAREGCTPPADNLTACSTSTIPVNGYVKWTDSLNVDEDEYWDRWYWVIKSDKWKTPPAVGPRGSVCMKFTARGEYAYRCADWVTGTVVVQ